MEFVGRKREIAALLRCLSQGRNVVLSGRFGVGRSRLVRHLAQRYSDRWQFLFADFSRPASECCNELLQQAHPRPPRGRRNRYTRIADAKKALRAEEAGRSRPRVVVLDNIATISRQKLAFIQDLRFDSGLLFIAIAESFIAEADLLRLRAVLYPSEQLILENLAQSEAADFFRRAAARNHLEWDETFVRMLAASSAGYPLSMHERLKRQIEAIGSPMKNHENDLPAGEALEPQTSRSPHRTSG